MHSYRRATRAVNGSQTHRNIFENELRIAASREDGVVKEYVFGTSINSPDYVKIQGVNYRIVKDHLGSPRLIVNATDGTIAQRMDYNEWGAVITDTNPGFQQYGFAGGIYDQATKLVKFGARDYNARVGRWTSKDPIRFDGGDTNLYGYVLQDPVNWIDFMGEAATSPEPYYPTMQEIYEKRLAEDLPLESVKPELYCIGTAKLLGVNAWIRRYPKAGGGGVGINIKDKNKIRFDIHKINGKYKPHIDIPGKVKHWPWK